MRSQLSRRNKSIPSFNDYEKNTAQVYSQNMITEDLNNLTIRSCPTVYPKTIQGDGCWQVTKNEYWLIKVHELENLIFLICTSLNSYKTKQRRPHHLELHIIQKYLQKQLENKIDKLG